MRGAEMIETRSLALHAAVARCLLADPSLWKRARERLRNWRATGVRHRYFLSAWDDLLEAPVEKVAAAILEPGDRGQRLRRASPFAFVVKSDERWKVWRTTRAEGDFAHADQGL